MFIKFIEIYHDFDIKLNCLKYHLRQVVVNKKNIVSFIETNYYGNVDAELLPQGLLYDQKYVRLKMVEDKLIDVVGDVDHIYKLLETDSQLNHRQTLKG